MIFGNAEKLNDDFCLPTSLDCCREIKEFGFELLIRLRKQTDSSSHGMLSELSMLEKSYEAVN